MKPELGPTLDKLKELKTNPPVKSNKERERDYEFIKKEIEGK